MFRYFSLTFKNSFRNGRRSALTISSLAASLCLLGVLIAVYHAIFFSKETPGQALRLIVRHGVSIAQPIPVAYEAKIRTIPGVKEVSTWNWFGGTYKDARDRNNFFARFGVEPKEALATRTELTMPENEKRAFITERRACIASRDIAEKLHWKLGDRITLIGDIYPVTLELTLRGIFDDPDAYQSLFFNADYLRDSLPQARRNWNSTFVVLADSPEDVPRIAKAIDDTFANATPTTKTESEQQFALSFVSLIGNIKVFLLCVCAAVTFTILLVSGNTMAMSVRERIKEVGVLKTLGFTKGAILGIVVGEAITLALIGGVIGLLIAEFLAKLVGHAGEVYLGQLHGLSLTLDTTLFALGVAAATGLIGSFIPAWNAARTNILDSLRYSG